MKGTIIHNIFFWFSGVRTGSHLPLRTLETRRCRRPRSQYYKKVLKYATRFLTEDHFMRSQLFYGKGTQTQTRLNLKNNVQKNRPNDQYFLEIFLFLHVRGATLQWLNFLGDYVFETPVLSVSFRYHSLELFPSLYYMIARSNGIVPDVQLTFTFSRRKLKLKSIG